MRRFFLLLILLFVFLGISANFYFRNVTAQDLTSDTSVSQKLEDILTKQNEILSQIDSLKKEIRIRCSN